MEKDATMMVQKIVQMEPTKARHANWWYWNDRVKEGCLYSVKINFPSSRGVHIAIKVTRRCAINLNNQIYTLSLPYAMYSTQTLHFTTNFNILQYSLYNHQ